MFELLMNSVFVKRNIALTYTVTLESMELEITKKVYKMELTKKINTEEQLCQILWYHLWCIMQW